MVSSWQARLPGNSLSNPVITQLPSPICVPTTCCFRDRAQGGGFEGEVSEVFFSSGSPHLHLCQSSSRSLPSPPPQVTLMCTGTFSLRFWVDGIAGGQVAGPGGRSRIRGPDSAERARGWAWAQGTSVGFSVFLRLSLSLGLSLLSPGPKTLGLSSSEARGSDPLA